MFLLILNVNYFDLVFIVDPQVLHLMSIYNGMSGKESNLEQSYALLDLASQVALRVCVSIVDFG
jgi:hypothetical protein